MSDLKSKGGGEQNLSVALRIRPLSEDEILMGATQIAHKVQEKMVVLMDPMEDPEDVLRANRSREKQYVFDYTFDGAASQETVYRTTSQFLIPNVTSGYNATVFAYGATGAGKTYTMLGTDDEPGIMARALNDLFLEMDKTSDDMAYKVSMSYLEIYNEMIRDLLNPSVGILDLREDAKGGVQVAGLSEVTARSTNEVMEMLLKGNKERTQEPTAANKTSSRSHAVLQVMIKQQNRVRSTQQEVRMGKLFMIDLAGSERAANTHNRGKRMVEGAHINRSLLALGNCINALTDQKGSKYVNYRDSKLTRLLKDALGGNCKTVMIAHISPASIHYEESRNTLVYADRAKHIKTKVRRNVTDVAYHIAQYTNIIQELREEILRLRHRLQDKTTSPHNGANIQVVQAEVLETKRVELNKLKEQLLISFKDQMELRKSLMELNNATMEISLETNRNQMIISEWEVERTKSARREGNDTADPESKALELSGAGSDDVPEPEDVKLAREELKVLHDEKHRTEKLRSTVQKELEQAKMKTKKVEETIPQRINTEDQREILNLLCKVHQLEIVNTETQSACLLREFQIKRKDMVISRFRQHQNLCDQIIRRQREIMQEQNVEASKELEELYSLYKQERDDRMMLEDSGNISPEIRLKAPSMISNYRSMLQDDVEQLGPLIEVNERRASQRQLLSPGYGDERLFSRREKWTKEASLSSLGNGVQGGSMDDPERPGSGKSSPSKLSMDRTVIATGTRNIAALAAKKRSKAHNDLLNLERQFGGEPRALGGVPQHPRDSYLTQSTLANHDRRYGDSMLPTIKTSEDNLDNISTGTKNSINTDSTLPPIRDTRLGRGDNRRNRRGKGYDYSYSQQAGYGHRRGDNGRPGNESPLPESTMSEILTTINDATVEHLVDTKYPRYDPTDDMRNSAGQTSNFVTNSQTSEPPTQSSGVDDGGARPKYRNNTNMSAGAKLVTKPVSKSSVHPVRQDKITKKSGSNQNFSKSNSIGVSKSGSNKNRQGLNEKPVGSGKKGVVISNVTKKQNVKTSVNHPKGVVSEVTFVSSNRPDSTNTDLRTSTAKTSKSLSGEIERGLTFVEGDHPRAESDLKETAQKSGTLHNESDSTKRSHKASETTVFLTSLNQDDSFNDIDNISVIEHATPIADMHSNSETTSKAAKMNVSLSQSTKLKSSNERKKILTSKSVDTANKTNAVVPGQNSSKVKHSLLPSSAKNALNMSSAKPYDLKNKKSHGKSYENEDRGNNLYLTKGNVYQTKGKVHVRFDDGEGKFYEPNNWTNDSSDIGNSEQTETDDNYRERAARMIQNLTKSENKQDEDMVFREKQELSRLPLDVNAEANASLVDTTLDISLPISNVGDEEASESGRTYDVMSTVRKTNGHTKGKTSKTKTKSGKNIGARTNRQSQKNTLRSMEIRSSEPREEMYTGRIRRDDSVLNIMGKAPVSARPVSLKHQPSVKRLKGRVPKSGKRAKSDTALTKDQLYVGSGEVTPPGPPKRGAKKGGYRTNDLRVAGTPNRGQKTKKQVPTIPTYRKGDITVTGFSLPR